MYVRYGHAEENSQRHIPTVGHGEYCPWGLANGHLRVRVWQVKADAASSSRKERCQTPATGTQNVVQVGSVVPGTQLPLGNAQHEWRPFHRRWPYSGQTHSGMSGTDTGNHGMTFMSGGPWDRVNGPQTCAGYAALSSYVKGANLRIRNPRQRRRRGPSTSPCLGAMFFFFEYPGQASV